MLKILFFSFYLSAFGIHAEDHGHDQEKEHKDEHKNEHIKEHKEEGDHDEHGNEGFKLNKTAIKNFGLTYVDYKAPSISISSKAIFKSLSEVNLYRLRSGTYKRIDFITLEKNKEIWKVKSIDLAPGDKIVVDGIGYLRIAEIAASGGLSDSHSH
jgi:hypothetical protein